MIVLKRILVPTDFSEASAVALRYGQALTERFGASLHLLHVIEDRFIPGPAAEGYMPLPGYFEEMERNAREQLDKMLRAAEVEKRQATLFTKRGSPFLEIVRYAKSQDIDVIVMGTHGRGPIAHMLMGSVAEKVVRKAPCPVLTVRHPEHEFVMP
jgi:nucleotide-binding universal stress UspA family protein